MNRVDSNLRSSRSLKGMPRKKKTTANYRVVFVRPRRRNFIRFSPEIIELKPSGMYNTRIMKIFANLSQVINQGGDSPEPEPGRKNRRGPLRRRSAQERYIRSRGGNYNKINFKPISTNPI